MGTFVVVCISLVFLVVIWLYIWSERREDKRRLEGGFRMMVSEIKNDEQLLKVLKLMIKNGKLSPKEIGNKLTAKIIIERMQDLGAMSGIWFIPLVRQKGSKFSIHPFWMETMKGLDQHGWDVDKLKLEFKIKLPI